MAHKSSLVKRYAAAIASLVVILPGTLVAPRLLPNNAAPKTGEKPPVLQSETPAPVPSPAEEYALVFNKADSRISGSPLYTSDRFWQELTSDEIQKVFPGLTGMYDVTATANFRSGEAGAALHNITAHATSAGGLATYIQIAPGNPFVDYLFDTDVKTSDILGTAVTAGCFVTDSNEAQRSVFYFASFELSGLGYYAELSGGESERAVLEDEFFSLISLLIKGGAADISIFDNTVIPEIRYDELDLNEALADPDFGAYLPRNMPSGFAFESAVRFINQESDYLSAVWTKGMGDIHWSVSHIGEDDKARLTSVDNTENYDLSLYPIPRAGSVPLHLLTIVNDPIFRIEDLTLEAVRARSYSVQDAGDISGPRLRFGVLYGDVLVELSVKGTAPEDIFDILRLLPFRPPQSR